MIKDQKANGNIIGVYVIGGIGNDNINNLPKIGTTKKPNFFRRFFTWLFLGWKWVSVENLKNNN